MKHSINKVFYLHFPILFILISSVTFSNDMAKEYSYWLYGLQLLLFTVVVIRQKYLFYFLSPVMLLIYYINISFLLGNYAFSHEIVLSENNLRTYRLVWKNHNYLVFYVLFANTVLFYMDSYFRKYYKRILNSLSFSPSNNYHLSIIIISSFVFLIFIFFPINVSILGGSGEMSYVPKAIAAINIFYFLATKRHRYRFFIYLIIIVLFASFSYTNKREAIFLVMPILLMEAVINKNIISIRQILSIIVLIVAMIFLILVMSIQRGYGGYVTQGSNIFTVVPFVFDYIKEPLFLKYFFFNIETNYTYFHSFNAMEYVAKDMNLLSLGSTLVKFIFIPFPRVYFDFIKPDSIITLYTSLYSPGLRATGGSLPPNVYAEYFWNFHYLGIFICVLIFGLFSMVFFKTLKWILFNNAYRYSWCLFGYSQFLTYMRGSGLDMYFVYILFGFIFSALIYRGANLLCHPRLAIIRQPFLGS